MPDEPRAVAVGDGRASVARDRGIRLGGAGEDGETNPAHEGGVLHRDGRDVHLPPKAMDVLLCLLESPGAVVSKEALMGRVWADTAVTDASLTETVRTLRNVLGDDPRRPTYVQTVHRRGYRFIAPVQPAGDSIPSAGADPAEGNLRAAGPVASWGTRLTFGARRQLGTLAVFIERSNLWQKGIAC